MGLEAEAAPQQSSELPVFDVQDASKHPPVQHPLPTAIDGENAEANPAEKPSRISAHGSYKCVSGKHSGRLFVTSVDVRFEAALGSRDQWEIKYENMHRVEKVRNSDPITNYLIDVSPLTAKFFLTD